MNSAQRLANNTWARNYIAHLRNAVHNLENAANRKGSMYEAFLKFINANGRQRANFISHYNNGNYLAAARTIGLEPSNLLPALNRNAAGKLVEQIKASMQSKLQAYQTLGRQTNVEWAVNQFTISRNFGARSNHQLLSNGIRYLMENSPALRGIVREWAKKTGGRKISLIYDGNTQPGTHAYAYLNRGGVYFSRQLMLDIHNDMRNNRDVVYDRNGNELPVVLIGRLSHELGHAIAGFEDGLARTDRFEGTNQVFNTFVGRELGSYYQSGRDTNNIDEYSGRWGR